MSGRGCNTARFRDFAPVKKIAYDETARPSSVATMSCRTRRHNSKDYSRLPAQQTRIPGASAFYSQSGAGCELPGRVRPSFSWRRKRANTRGYNARSQRTRVSRSPFGWVRGLVSYGGHPEKAYLHGHFAGPNGRSDLLYWQHTGIPRECCRKALGTKRVAKAKRSV